MPSGSGRMCTLAAKSTNLLLQTHPFPQCLVCTSACVMEARGLYNAHKTTSPGLRSVNWEQNPADMNSWESNSWSSGRETVGFEFLRRFLHELLSQRHDSCALIRHLRMLDCRRVIFLRLEYPGVAAGETRRSRTNVVVSRNLVLLLAMGKRRYTASKETLVSLH